MNNNILEDIRAMGPALGVMSDIRARDKRMAELTERLERAWANKEIGMAEYVESKRILGLGMAAGIESRIYYQ